MASTFADNRPRDGWDRGHFGQAWQLSRSG